MTRPVTRFAALFLTIGIALALIFSHSRTAHAQVSPQACHTASAPIALAAAKWTPLYPPASPQGTVLCLLTNGDGSAIQWQFGPTARNDDAGILGTDPDAGTVGAEVLASGQYVSIPVTYSNPVKGTVIYVRSTAGTSAGDVTFVCSC